MPVSYTHLDVYKRQIDDCVEAAGVYGGEHGLHAFRTPVCHYGYRAVAGKMLQCAGDFLRVVHQDVYKRQVLAAVRQ